MPFPGWIWELVPEAGTSTSTAGPEGGWQCRLSPGWYENAAMVMLGESIESLPARQLERHRGIPDSIRNSP